MTDKRADDLIETDSVDVDAAAWLAEIPGVDPEIEMVHMRLKRLGQQTTRMLTGIAEHHGMTLGDWETLSMLRRSGPPYVMTPSELVKALDVTSGTISVRIERLIRAGLIEPDNSRADGRSRPIRLTEEGALRWQAATAERNAIERRVFEQALGSVEIEYLNLLLRWLLRGFEDELEPKTPDR